MNTDVCAKLVRELDDEQLVLSCCSVTSLLQ